MGLIVNNVESRILEIFKQKLGIEQNELEAKSFQMLEMDELDMIMLAVCLEDEFRLIIDDEKLFNVKDFQELVIFIKGELANETSPINEKMI